jgi:hypothetical protein
MLLHLSQSLNLTPLSKSILAGYNGANVLNGAGGGTVSAQP